MKELVIISGKGGTGKTSLTASFACLAHNAIIIDADVDAADLHLILKPEILKQEEFSGGSKANIDKNVCTKCGACIEVCNFDAVTDDFVIDAVECEGCKLCFEFCPENAVKFSRQICGEWYISDSRAGTMIHAKLGIAQENSGMLVSLLRREAQKAASQNSIPLIITDGPPGTGCPVIASVTGADAVLIITEPTLSGMHDMKRVKELTDLLKIPAMFCINKYDINTEITEEIQEFGSEHGLKFLGNIPYDSDLTKAMLAQKSLVEFSDNDTAKAVKDIWKNAGNFLAGLKDRLM
jgi:MinD superfamily P-loop ATPase